jgi:outer membrane protein TolC
MLLLCTAGLCVAGGCANPLGERDEDQGQRVSLQRVREVQRLGLDQFRSAATGGANAANAPGGAAQAGAAPSGGGAEGVPPALQRPASRFAGLQAVSLGLEQARAEALRNNLELKVALVDPAIAEESLRAERAKFEAVFRPSLRYSHNEQATFQTTVSNESKTWSGGGGVDIPLRTGGRANVSLTQSRTETGVNAFNPVPVFYSTDLAFSISQPLLRNGGRTVATTSIQIAGYQAQIAEARTKLTVISQLALVERAYWQVYAARRALEVTQQQYELAVTQLQQAQRRVKAGESPELEVSRAQSGVASRLESIVVAENNVLVAQRELKRRMNMADLGVESGQLVVPTTAPEPVDLELDGEKLTAMALGERMELLEVELQVLADAASERFARNQTLPLLDLEASYNIDGIGQSYRNAVTSGLAKRDFQSYRLGVSAEVPLGNEAAEARLRRATLTRVQRLATRQSREQSVKQDVLDAVDRVRAGWQRIMAAREAALLAGRVLQGEQRQFEAGQRTSTDVLDAAARLAEAQLSEIRALSDYQIAQVDLAVATGTVLGAAGVSWQPNRDTSSAPEIRSTDSPLAPSLIDDRP